MDMAHGCRSAYQACPAFVHGNHRLCSIQNQHAETCSGACRRFLSSVESCHKDAVGSQRLGEEQDAKSKHNNKNTSKITSARR